MKKSIENKLKIEDFDEVKIKTNKTKKRNFSKDFDSNQIPIQFPKINSVYIISYTRCNR